MAGEGSKTAGGVLQDLRDPRELFLQALLVGGAGVALGGLGVVLAVVALVRASRRPGQ